MLNRRKFLTRSALLAAGAPLLHPTIASASGALDLAQRRDRGFVDPRGLARSAELKALVQKALDTAAAHKASYAEVHRSLEFERSFEGQRYLGEICTYHIGVRALNNGYWGFASAPWLSDTDVVRVAIDAATHAAGFGATRPARAMAMAPHPQVERNGDWTTPAEILPYEMDIGEVIDGCKGVTRHYSQIFRHRHGEGDQDAQTSWGAGSKGFHLARTDVINASSEGSYTVQTFHHGEPGTVATSILENTLPKVPLPSVHYVAQDTGLVPSLFPTSGLENYFSLPVEAMFERWIEAVKWAKALPLKPMEVGKYDLLIDWQTMGRVLGATLGPATQLDLALGDHANGVGTSYLGPDIETYLGSVVAAPQVTIRADRSTPGAEATVKWDSEGVVPRDVELVREGRLVNYQTGREGAGWLRTMPGSSAIHTTMHTAMSAGFMGRNAQTAANVPLQHLPNFTLVPDANGPSFAEMLTSMKKGYLLAGANVSTDFQCLNGVAAGRLYEVEHGKITAHIVGGALLFRSPEFWNNIVTLGGPASARWTSVSGQKGEPLQEGAASISAVPAIVKQATLVRGDNPAAP
ncbi:MAG TPA: metallopeptidase TldD-related protein [Chthoniobacteraceae bacterium]|nr:metallopeptidase TldD-related protein [Chthoniobacteraceae bacterium]